MKNKFVKWLVILISAMFFIVVFSGGVSSNTDYEDYEKHYVRYTSGPPSTPLDYNELIRQSRINTKLPSKILII